MTLPLKYPNIRDPMPGQKEETKQLFEDIKESIDGATNIEELDPYFLGSIVLIKGDSANAQVVDGQQRLTTLTILLAALRSIKVRANQEDHITSFLFERSNPHILGSQNRYRLTLRDKDMEFFKRYIQEDAKLENLMGTIDHQLTDSQRNIKNNTIEFNSFSNHVRFSPN